MLSGAKVGLSEVQIKCIVSISCSEYAFLGLSQVILLSSPFLIKSFIAEEINGVIIWNFPKNSVYLQPDYV